MYCSNLSFKFSRQTQKKLVGFSHYGHFSSQEVPRACICPDDMTIDAGVYAYPIFSFLIRK
jgi:hypothetical protein